MSTNGTLVYLPGGQENVRRSVVWVDRRGGVRPLPAPPRGYEGPRVSPDGQRVAFTIREADADVWTLALDRGTWTRLTQELGEDESPVWNADGKRVTYSSTRDRSRLTLQKNADGSGAEEQLFTVEGHQHLVAWTPGGRTLLADENEPGDLFERTIGEKAPRVYLHTPFYKRGARLSPDGHRVAYAADESGRNEVYVQSADGRWRISVDGGTEPVWARSGRELFYRNGDKMMAVDVQAAPFRAGTPRVLFEGQYTRLVWGEADYDVSPDGQRFLMIKGEAQKPFTELHVIVNWFRELERLAR